MNKVVSGGQTGVDRAALDVAIRKNIPYGGWCPKLGWAEDMPIPPGLLKHYPNLRETPLAEPEQRTTWNVRDSTATLILTTDDAMERSRGTLFTAEEADRLRRPLLIVRIGNPTGVQTADAWLTKNLNDKKVLNIAGVRESEAPGIYAGAASFLAQLLPDADHGICW